MLTTSFPPASELPEEGNNVPAFAARGGFQVFWEQLVMSPARVSLMANGLFVGLLAALHGLKSNLDPSWHFISEYAIGKYGWLMQGAFLALAVANLGTLAAIRDSLKTVAGKIGAGLFLVGTFGTVLAGVCITDPMNTPPEAQTLHGTLHNVGGGLGLLGFIGTLIFSVRLLRDPRWRPARPAVVLATALLILGFLISFVSIAMITAQHNGVFGPDTPVGWPNRIGILSGCAWLAIIAWQAGRLNKHENEGS